MTLRRSSQAMKAHRVLAGLGAGPSLVWTTALGVGVLVWWLTVFTWTWSWGL